MTKVALYIPCRNGMQTLPEVFQAVSSQTMEPDLLLLIDDRSDDGTGDLARAMGWTVVATTAEKNGLAVARNTAARCAHEHGCDILAGIDADAVPAPTYIESLRSVFTTRHAVSGVCGNMQERFTQTPSDQWRAVYMPQHYGEDPRLNPPILYGSSAAHRLQAVFALGGFNEALRTNYEDTDLTQRLLAAGHTLAYVPELRLEHLKRDTPDSVLRMFWNWYLPPADLAGYFSSAQSWLSHRLPWIWGDYRRRSRSDATHPRLTVITAALPWVQVIRDLRLLASRFETSAHLEPICDFAVALYRDNGFPEPLIAWLAERLHNALEPSPAGRPEPVHPAVLSAIRDVAMESVPRRTFWSAVDESWYAVVHDG
jgi:glycosyltransferase involved in cell wall biosynthesis